MGEFRWIIFAPRSHLLEMAPAIGLLSCPTLYLPFVPSVLESRVGACLESRLEVDDTGDNSVAEDVVELAWRNTVEFHMCHAVSVSCPGVSLGG